MDVRQLTIDNPSDCSACTKREAEEFTMLAEVKCDLLTDVTCPECGRIVSVFVETFR